jgi:hypothetical protein
VKNGKKEIPKPPNLNMTTQAIVGTSKVVLLGAENLTAGAIAMPEMELSRNDGSKPAIKPYLGALAHVVVVPLAGDKLLHVHPMEGSTTNKLKIHTVMSQT